MCIRDSLYAIRPLTLFSSVLLTLAGGFLFGPAWGVLYTVIGANLSGPGAVFLGRFFCRGALGDGGSQGGVLRHAPRMRRQHRCGVAVPCRCFSPYWSDP